MGYVKIKIKSVASSDDLQRWEDRMQEKAKCWNKFQYLDTVTLNIDNVDGLSLFTNGDFGIV